MGDEPFFDRIITARDTAEGTVRRLKKEKLILWLVIVSYSLALLFFL